jgi:2-keto-4-pentenoate hydratase/2-oxohepta-3-ene-1,7-dioic acid hydratase in catechol pathway
MKLATILHDGLPAVAVIDTDKQQAFLLADIVTGMPANIAGNMVSAIAHYGKARLPASGVGIDLDRVKLLAPILTPPQNILCVGKNYHDHAKEFTKSGFDAGATAADAVPEYPIVFTKPFSSISGPYDDIPLWPGLDQAVDYEAELAVVIGKGGRFIKKEEALNHVFGYTIINDVTARDLQRVHKQWFLGKGIDGFGPMGPWIVTADEVDVGNMRIICRINGEVRQDSNTSDLIFDVPTLIETISRSVTLSPGDIIATGTPAGVGIGFSPPKFLAEGDVVEIEIEGIGTIRNRLARVGSDQKGEALHSVAAD